MTLQQVKEELEEFYIKNKMLHTDCVQNSLMLVWYWGLRPYLVFLSGHCVVACPKRKMVLDPTVGCIWNTNTFNKDFFMKLLKGKKPDEYLSWYLEDKYQRWWDYTFKYDKNKHRFETREEWDNNLEIEITSLTPSSKVYRDIGKFSDYMR
jgi:hypothetical protein